MSDYLWLFYEDWWLFVIIYFDGWLFAIICDNFMCMDDYLWYSYVHGWLFVIILWGFIKIIQMHVNICEFIGSKWCFDNVKRLYYYWVVYVTTGVGLKSQNRQFKIF